MTTNGEQLTLAGFGPADVWVGKNSAPMESPLELFSLSTKRVFIDAGIEEAPEVWWDDWGTSFALAILDAKPEGVEGWLVCLDTALPSELSNLRTSVEESPDVTGIYCIDALGTQPSNVYHKTQWWLKDLCSEFNLQLAFDSIEEW